MSATSVWAGFSRREGRNAATALALEAYASHFEADCAGQKRGREARAPILIDRRLLTAVIERFTRANLDISPARLLSDPGERMTCLVEHDGAVASCTSGGAVRMWNVATGAKIRNLYTPTAQPLTALTSHLGELVAVDDHARATKWICNGHGIQQYGLTSGGVGWLMRPPATVKFLADGNFSAIANVNEDLVFKVTCPIRLDGRPSTQSMSWPVSPEPVYALCFWPETDLVASGGPRNCDVQLWSPDYPKSGMVVAAVQTLTAHEEPVRALAVWRGQLASGSADRTVRVWGTDYSLLQVLQCGHYLTALAEFEGYLFAATIPDLRIWAASGECLKVVDGARLTELAVIGGRLLSIGAFDASLRVWEWD